LVLKNPRKVYNNPDLPGIKLFTICSKIVNP
jgi:hypothetical protein